MHRTSAETSMRPDRSHEGLQGQKTRPYVADYAPGLRPRPNTPGYSSGPEHPRTSALVGGRLQRGQIAEHFRRCQGRRAISKKNYALQVGCGAITQALHKLLLLAPRFARRPWCRPTDRRFVDLYYEHLREQPL